MISRAFCVVAAFTLFFIMGCNKNTTTDKKAAADKAAPAGDKAAAKAAPAADKAAPAAAKAAPAADKAAPAADKAAPAGDKAADKVAPAAAKAAPAAPVAPPAAGSNHAKLIGTWSVDINKLMEDPKAQAAIKANPQAKEMMTQMMGKMSMVVTKDTFTAKMGPKSESITYIVKSESGNKLTLEGKPAGKPTVEVMEVTFTDNDHIVMAKGGGKDKLPLVRAK